MKTFKSASLVLSLMATMAISGCSNDDNTPNDGTDPTITYPTGNGTYDGVATSEGILFNNGTQIGNGDQDFCFTGKQTIKKGTYLLKGWVYVRPGSELTIEAGTIIKGDKQTKGALIIEPGAKLYAEGTKDSPIVFTSEEAKGNRKPGDWGGLIICGKAKNNQGDMQIEGGPKTHHGGNDDNDNSGVLRYVRVEFAGNPFQVDKEINGITFGSVGRGTTIDHLQVSYSNDDSYEWFGGSVDCKYLIAYKGWDDDFDTDNGFSGKVQYCLAIRDPKIADLSQSNGFESDNCADGNSTATPLTTCVFSNVTFIGPATEINKTAGFVNNDTYINAGSVYPDNKSSLGKFQAAMQIRRSSNLNCFNSVAVGWPIGLIIDGEKGNCVEKAKAGNIKLKNIFFAGMDAIGTDANKKYEDVLGTYKNGTVTYDNSQQSYSHTFFLSESSNKVFNSESDLKLADNSSKPTGQKYLPQSGSPLLGAASFTDALLSGFDAVTYVGAFSGESDNWMEGWTNFDPQNTDY